MHGHNASILTKCYYLIYGHNQHKVGELYDNCLYYKPDTDVDESRLRLQPAIVVVVHLLITFLI
jgi:hypothetical protein